MLLLIFTLLLLRSGIGKLANTAGCSARSPTGGGDMVDDTKYDVTRDPRSAGKQESAAGERRYLL